MKVLIINGSPRRENTWKIICRVKETLTSLDENIFFDEVDLIDENIPSCIGCYNCFMDGEDTCPHANTIQPIVNKMKECDGLIITSPVYALNVSGLMKNFIDHLAYFYHRPYFFEDKAMVVVTTAGAAHKKVGKYLDETLRNWGYNQRFKLCFVHAHDVHGYLPLDTKQKIDKESVKFYTSIQNKILKSPSMKALFMYNVWRAMAVNSHIPADNKYWVENKLIDTEYYDKVPCSFIKKLPMKVFYKLMLIFLSKNSVKQE
ncbi:MAG: hypothetical protein BZ138_03565 [Methanosphaera sp. rholeuAM270]|nr:MAG: hypothetical protein BZ138_03565 [Methanosphaera sp. rholeuAM270]